MQSVIWENKYSVSDAEEKMEVEASSEMQHCASYTEEGSDLDKAEPFADDHSTAPTAQIRTSSLAICPQRLINRTDKYVVVNNVGPKKWRHLARHMNLTELEIDCIDYEYDKYGLHEKIYQVILHWENKFRGRVTVGELVRVLKEANLHEVALKLDH